VAPERFFLHPSASQELREATRWYRKRDPDIAADFLNAIDAAVANIVSAPQRWPVKGRWRRYYLRRFPYMVAYRQAGELIEIGAVAHQHRRPDYWSRRR
jgi:plasmid stabilization system protein ParE